MALYTRLRKTASRLLRSYGIRVSMERVSPGAYEPSTGRQGAESVHAWRAYALKMGITSENWQIAQGDGAGVLAGDMLLLVECSTTVPAKGDRVIFPRGERWIVQQGRPVEPAGTTVLFKGVIRRG